MCVTSLLYRQNGECLAGISACKGCDIVQRGSQEGHIVRICSSQSRGKTTPAKHTSQPTRDADPMLVSCWANVDDGGPALGQCLVSTLIQCLVDDVTMLGKQLLSWPSSDTALPQRLLRSTNVFTSDEVQGCTSDMLRGSSTDCASDMLRGSSTGYTSDILRGSSTGYTSDMLRGTSTGYTSDMLRGSSTGYISDMLRGSSTGYISDMLRGSCTGYTSDMLRGSSTGYTSDILRGVMHWLYQ